MTHVSPRARHHGGRGGGKRRSSRGALWLAELPLQGKDYPQNEGFGVVRGLDRRQLLLLRWWREQSPGQDSHMAQLTLSQLADMSFDEMKVEMERSWLMSTAPRLESREPRPAWCPTTFSRSEAVPRRNEEDDDYHALSSLDENIVKRGLSAKAKRALRTHIACRRFEDPITRDVLPPGSPVVVLPCGHEFARAGIMTWFERNRTCPVCRLEIEA